MTQKTGELVITRVYNAPRELVFKCITEPEHLTHFWGPVGMQTPIENIKVDLRVGGVFETVMVNEATGDQYPSRGVYTEIDPPTKLAWAEPGGGMTTTTTFTDLGDGRTEVRIHQENVPEMYATEDAQAGFNSSLDRFEAYLATIV
jgi:uncharacterized protein YndB with AHSA1/START domain